MFVPRMCQCTFKEAVVLLTVKEGEQEEHKQRRQNVKVTLSQQLLLGDNIDMVSSSIIDDLDLLVRDTGFPYLSHNCYG